MAAKGLVTEVSGNPRSFTAVDPRVALAALVDERRGALDDIEGLIPVVATLLESIGTRRGADPAPAIEVLTRPEQISLHYQKELAEAQQEILSLSKGRPYQRPERPNEGELNALGRGVPYRVIYDRAVLGPPPLHDMGPYIEAGEEARVLSGIPMRLRIFDRRRALMHLARSHDPAQWFTAVVVHDEGLAATLAMAFDFLWEKADPIDHNATPSR